jgi:MurNAc alpha-1-phosphate uridylyltransferase
MKAMILAAGRGERLRPLTDEIPKPLIKAGGMALIEYHLDNLADAGFKDVIINTAWHAEKIHELLEDGKRYGVHIHYSDEGTALETAGGIINALPLLGDEPFLVVNGDVWCHFDFTELPELEAGREAHLILVDNPDHNEKGDFALENGLVRNSGDTMHTYSGIGIYHPAFFAGQQPGVLPLAPVLRKKCEQGLVSGQLYGGLWTDVGTIERLQELEKQLAQ